MKNLSFLILFTAMMQFTSIFPQTSLEKDFPVLSKSYNISEKRTDFVIVIDRSGSMKLYWEDVMQAVSDLISSLPENDYISVLGFDGSCSELVLSRTITEQSKSELRQELSSLPAPSGETTDLYGSLEKAFEELNRPNSSSIKFLFYFTDFEHSPSDESKWAKSTDYAPLRSLYDNYIVKAGRLLRVFGLQLPLSPRAGADFNSFSAIFDNSVTRITFSNRQTLGEWFEKIKAIVEREKIKIIAANELADPIVIEQAAQQIHFGMYYSNAFDVVLRNTTSIPKKISEIRLMSNDTVVVAAGSQGGVLLNPDTSVSFPIEIQNARGGDASEMHFEITYGNEPSNEFAKLDISAQMTAKVPFTAALTVRSYFTLLGYALILIILCTLLYLLWKIWLRPEYHFGVKPGVSFRCRAYLNGISVLDKSFAASRNQVSISNGDLNMGVNIPPFALSFIPSKPKLFRAFPKRGTYITKENDIQFKMGNEAVPQGIVRNSKPVAFGLGITVESTFLRKGERQKLNITLSR